MGVALPVLAVNFAFSAALFTLLWLLSVRLKDPSFVDSWWALGIVVLAWATYAQLPAHGPQALILLGLATLWGGRLGLYLLWRWRRHGLDRRYEALAAAAREQHGWGFATSSLLWVFAPQLVLQFIVALPVMLGQIPQTENLGALGAAGAALALFGITYEAVADAQLAGFKAGPENVGKVMQSGLWRYSRHPNYFGEMCAWWGIYLVAAETGLGALGLAGPLLLTFLLTRVSGAPTTEPHLARTRPDYEAYKARTSAFIPLPPAR